MIQPRAQVALLGAPLDSGNLGVSALGLSTLHALEARLPHLKVLVFDNGRGVRRAPVSVGRSSVECEFRGLWISRRRYRPESLWSLDLASRVAPGIHPHLRALRRCDAVLDISGGDSFTDLYGPRRFKLVSQPKLIAQRLSLPLILLPQTYGPFTLADSTACAASIVSNSTLAWARDSYSFDRLGELDWNGREELRHRLGVDVAFGLPTRPPSPSVRAVVEESDGESGAIGINVSGLLYNDPQSARDRFQLVSRYDHTMFAVASELLRAQPRRLLLVPHVYSPRESDIAAARHLAARLGDPDRVSVLEDELDADEVKWVISRLHRFIGSRMHATIAALSSGVPAAAIAYSDKFRGVFASCGLEHRALDARLLDSSELSSRLVEAVASEADAPLLAAAVESVRGRVEEQFDEICSVIRPKSSRGGVHP